MPALLDRIREDCIYYRGDIDRMRKAYGLSRRQVIGSLFFLLCSGQRENQRRIEAAFGRINGRAV